MIYEPFNESRRKKAEFLDCVCLLIMLVTWTAIFLIACSLWGGK